MEQEKHLQWAQTQIEGIFRGLLAGKDMVVAPLVGYGDESTRNLNEAARVLCYTPDQRRLLQIVYDLGCTDGGLKAAREGLAKVSE